MAKVRHAHSSPIGEYSYLYLSTAQATPAPVGALVNTSSATTIAAGTQVVTPLAMTNIVQGMVLNIANGTGTAEDVLVTATTATTFTAVFQYAHSGAYTILSRKGTNLGAVIVGNAGSGAVLTLYDGHPNLSPNPGQTIAVIQPSVNGNYSFQVACDQGLWYTLTATTAPNLTITYVDQPR